VKEENAKYFQSDGKNEFFLLIFGKGMREDLLLLLGAAAS